MDIIFDVNRWLFGLKKELALAANAKRIIRGSCSATHLDCVLMDNVLVGFCKTLLVVYVPSEGLEERINEFPSYLSFIVIPGFVGRQVTFESFHQIHYFLRCRQISFPQSASTIAHMKKLWIFSSMTLF